MVRQPKRNRAEREQFWRGLIERQQKSDQSIRSFCDAQGVSSPSFYSLRKRLKESNGMPTAQFVPIQLEQEAAPPAPQGRIEVQLTDGTCVRVEPGFDAQALRDVLAVLEDRLC